MITATGFGILESLVALGVVAAFIMVGLVRDKKKDTNKNH